jgi:hypothetical protein
VVGHHLRYPSTDDGADAGGRQPYYSIILDRHKMIGACADGSAKDY